MIETKDKVGRFLKDNEMHFEDIDMDVCCDIFIEEMQAGLEGRDSSLAMIPTYIKVGKEIPAGKPVIVLEAGGQGLFSKEVSEELLAIEDLQTIDVNSFSRFPQGDNPLAVICTNGGEQDRAAVWYVLDALIGRAAKFTAILLSSTVLKTGKGKNPFMPVCITAEGTTFYELKSLKAKVEYYLKSFLEEKHNRFIEIVSVENATLIGAAIAGLTN